MKYSACSPMLMEEEASSVGNRTFAPEPLSERRYREQQLSQAVSDLHKLVEKVALRQERLESARPSAMRAPTLSTGVVSKTAERAAPSYAELTKAQKDKVCGFESQFLAWIVELMSSNDTTQALEMIRARRLYLKAVKEFEDSQKAKEIFREVDVDEAFLAGEVERVLQRESRKAQIGIMKNGGAASASVAVWKAAIDSEYMLNSFCSLVLVLV